jgi:hypothetical protein
MSVFGWFAIFPTFVLHEEGSKEDVRRWQNQLEMLCRSTVFFATVFRVQALRTSSAVFLVRGARLSDSAGINRDFGLGFKVIPNFM